MMTVAELDKYREGLTNADVLQNDVEEEDSKFEVLQGANCYTWYYAIGRAKQPKTIAEFGVRHGYSLLSLSLGALHAQVAPDVVGWDCELDSAGSNERAFARLARYGTCKSIEIRKESTSKVEVAPKHVGYFDIVHVDGDHTEQGIQNELRLAEAMVKKTGWIVVDDCYLKFVDQWVRKRAEVTGRQVLWLPSQTSLAVMLEVTA